MAPKKSITASDGEPSHRNPKTIVAVAGSKRFAKKSDHNESREEPPRKKLTPNLPRKKPTKNASEQEPTSAPPQHSSSSSSSSPSSSDDESSPNTPKIEPIPAQAEKATTSDDFSEEAGNKDDVGAEKSSSDAEEEEEDAGEAAAVAGLIKSDWEPKNQIKVSNSKPSSSNPSRLEAAGSGNKLHFRRFWLEEDELKVLEGLLALREEKGIDSFPPLSELYEYLKPSLGLEITQLQLKTKLQHLMNMFRSLDDKFTKGMGKDVKGHKLALYEISKKIWSSIPAKNKKPRKEKSIEKEEGEEEGEPTSYGLLLKVLEENKLFDEEKLVKAIEVADRAEVAAAEKKFRWLEQKKAKLQMELVKLEQQKTKLQMEWADMAANATKMILECMAKLD